MRLLVLVVLLLSSTAHALNARRVRQICDEEIVTAFAGIGVYTQQSSTPLAASFCGCVGVSCRAATDIIVGCGGGIIPGNAGFLSQTAVIVGPQCAACGCGGNVSVTLAAQAICLGRP
jgi:hypothetical protein